MEQDTLKILTKIIKNKKGLTLMELIVGILMFTIISVTVSMVLAPILSAYTRANDFAEYNALLDNIANHLINDLSQSTEPPDFNNGWTDPANPARDEFLTITTQNRIIHYAVTDGILQREGVIDEDGDLVRRWFDVFSEDFYKRKLVSFMIEEETDETTADVTAYILTVRLTEARGAAPFEIERQYAVRPLILNQAG